MSRTSNKNNIRALRIAVEGRVQGIGFRPAVWRLARSLNIRGSVSNTSSGALITAQGRAADIAAFLRGLRTSVPLSARVERITSSRAALSAQPAFFISESRSSKHTSAEFPPDLDVCPDCLEELADPSGRRYRYPFTNCTNCGPRFSIVKRLPYDRPKTTMRPFKMCPECRREYKDPSDRRFHAQPVACPVCGPKLSLYSAEKKLPVENGKVLEKAAELISQGKILAVKGLGGYQLACSALNSKAVETLRKRKNRPHKPFALMVPDIETAKMICRVSPAEEELLSSRIKPIVLLRKLPSSFFRLPADLLAPDNAYLGVMLPCTPLHHLLFRSPVTSHQSPTTVLVMTSGNKADEPICRTEQEAFDKLGDIADYFLTHDREIHNRTDDSIVQALSSGESVVIRRSRGFVPEPVKLSGKAPAILSVGAELKNTFCLTRGKNAYVSPYIGDLDNKESLDFFKESVSRFTEFLQVKPKIIAHDLHPDYLSSVFAYSLSTVNRQLSTVPVQHHFAHIASVLAEKQLTKPVIGFSFDGTGYGPDGRIWGGECLLWKTGKFSRLSHFDYFRLPGGDTATKEIWRLAVSLMQQAGIEEIPAHIARKPWKEIRGMASKGVNSPECCSAGRLFDAVAAMIGLKNEVSFEAQAAIELESLAVDTTVRKGYNIYDKHETRSSKLEKPLIIPLKLLIQQIWEDKKAGVSNKTISAKFHLTLAEIILSLSKRFGKEYGIKDIALSGGCFQNRILLSLAKDKLEKSGFKVHFNTLVPANDGGISLGQSYLTANSSNVPSGRHK